MDFIPIRPTICEDCPTYNSNDNMTFRLMHLSAGKSMEMGDNIIHIVYLYKGSVMINGVTGKTCTIPMNHFFLIARNEKYTVTASQDAEMVIQDVLYPFFVCEKNTFDYTYAPTLEQVKGHYKFCSLELREPLLSCIKSIVFLIRGGALCNHMIRLKMKEIFLYYKYYYSVEELAKMFYPIVTKQMEFFIKIQGAAPRAKTVKELAELSGYSLSNLKAHFKPYFGETPYNWLLTRKLDSIRMSLADDTKPLKLIVYEFGFSDQSHLNNFCKRYLGGTALQVRQHLLDK